MALKNLIANSVPNAVPKPKSKQKEEEREGNAKWKKVFGYLEGFKKSFASLTGVKDKKKGFFDSIKSMFGGIKGLLGMLIPSGLMSAIPGVLMGMLGKIGIGAIFIGAFMALWSSIVDGFDGWMKAKSGEWGNIDKVSGAIGGFFGGEGSGFWNALKQGGKWALMGMAIGVIGGPPGILAGAIIGGAIGMLMGWIGGEAIANWVDGTVKVFRNLLDLPEAMSDEQKAAAEKEIAQLEKDVKEHTDLLATYKEELASADTDLERRIQLRRLISNIENTIDDKKDKIASENLRLAASDLGEMDAERNTLRKRIEIQGGRVASAKMSLDASAIGLFWAKQVHGVDSEEYKQAKKNWEEKKSALADETQHWNNMKTQHKDLSKERSDLRTKIDKEHRTAMGNVRLFFKGETDWQKQMGQTYDNMVGAVKIWVRDNIYDPGMEGGPPGTGRPMKLFGMELSFPKMTFPTWAEIKSILPSWMGGGDKPFMDVMGKHFESWKLALPTWADIKKKLPPWLGGASEDAATSTLAVSKLFGEHFDKWEFSFPSWADIKATLPTWLGGSEGKTMSALVDDTVGKWKFSLPTWDSIKNLLPTWLGGEGMADAFLDDAESFGDDEPSDVVTGSKTKFPTGEELLNMLMPGWLTEFMHDPLAYIKSAVGWTKEDKEDTTAQSFFDEWKLPSWESFKEMMPEWLRDPVGWVKGLFRKGKEAGEEEAKALQQAESLKHQKALEEMEAAKAESGGKRINRQVQSRGDTAQRYFRDTAEDAGLVDFKAGFQDTIDQKAFWDAVNRTLTEGSAEVSAAMIRTLMKNDEWEAKDIRTEDSYTDKVFLETMLKRLEPLQEGANPNSNSFYVHDKHVEKAVYQLINAYATSTRGTLLNGLALATQGSSQRPTVNHVTIAPSSSNTVSSAAYTEQTYGTSDPFTSVSGAYG